MSRGIHRYWLAFVLTLALLAVACGGQSTPAAGGQSPAASPAQSSAPSTAASAAPSTAASAAPSQPTAGGAGGSGAAASLTGAGSSFVNPFFSRAFPEYSKTHPQVTLNYQPIGSGGGIQQFTAQTVDFGASDVPMNQKELSAATQANGSVVQVPVALGAVAVVYNLPGVQKGLKLTPEALAGIFSGKITKWNDPAIARENAGVTLPGTDIAVAHRSDGSGTTYIFTDYLSSISPEWKNGPGVGKEVEWPVGVGGKGNDGVAAAVKQAPGGIGYVELAYALQGNMTYAAIKNKDGKYVEPTLQATTAAAGQFPTVSAEKFSIVNAAGAESYPIVGYTWAMLWEKYKDPQKATALKDVMTWIVADAQDKFAKDLSYAPLPSEVRQVAKSSIDKVK